LRPDSVVRSIVFPNGVNEGGGGDGKFVFEFPVDKLTFVLTVRLVFPVVEVVEDIAANLSAANLSANLSAANCSAANLSSSKRVVTIIALRDDKFQSFKFQNLLRQKMIF
jgi:hypothetical protein